MPPLEKADYVFLAMSLVSCLLIGTGILTLRKKAFLQQHGAFVQGTVLSIERHLTGSGSYYLTIQFFTAEEGWITAGHSVGEWPTRFRAGDTVRVLYDPENPMQFSILSDGNSFEPWYYILCGAALFVAAIAGYVGS